jgi:heat shock protein beta
LKPKLIKLLRFQTSKSEGQLISLDEYVDRMKANQKHIYYITGESVEAVSTSPFVERLLKKGLEVVYMVDPVDEYLLQPMTEYDGTQLMSVTKEGLKIDDNEEKRLERYKEEFKPLITWMQSTLGSDRVSKVTVSNRVASSPMVIVTGQYGWSSNMERIMAGQTFANAKEHSHLKSKKTLEINPLHPIIRELKERVASNGGGEDEKTVIELLWDAALLQSGFVHENPADFAKRIHRLSSVTLKVDPDAVIEEETIEDEPTTAGGAAADEEINHEEL